MEKLNFKLEIYEGPLDLLLSLITKNKVNIYDIPIALILDQYLEYLQEMRRMDMDIAGEFITMAAELMLIKSRMMLPKNPLAEEEDPRERLAAALLEYKRAKETAQYLNEQYELYGGRYTKSVDESFYNSVPELMDQDVKLLEEAFKRIINKNIQFKSTLQPPEKTLEKLLKHKVTSIPEKIFSIMRYLYKNGQTSFEDLILLSNSRSDIIASFAAVLELLKANRIKMATDNDEIILYINREG